MRPVSERVLTPGQLLDRARTSCVMQVSVAERDENLVDLLAGGTDVEAPELTGRRSLIEQRTALGQHFPQTG